MLPILTLPRWTQPAWARCVALVAFILIAGIARPPITLRAQDSTGKVCVQAFGDTIQKNGHHDPGEPLLSDISVELMVSQNVIIANHVTDGTEPYCFANLPPQQYTVSFSSPLYEATTSTAFTFTLAPGEAPIREYGAVPRATPVDTTVSNPGLNFPMTTPVRIGLAAAGALVVMILVAGIGMLIFGLFLRR